jgi:gliding motility-associated lipoprotein GldD
MKRSFIIIVILATISLLVIWFFIHETVNLPKPRGYFRIELPEKNYFKFDSSCPVEFEIPSYGKMEIFQDSIRADSCRFNVFMPRFKARIHCTYMPVGRNFNKLINDAYGFAAKHEMKASGLKRTLIEDQQRRVFGIVYEIEGDAASQMQFFLTDSVNHFFRGSLYFYNSPNADSIAPVLNFLNDDIMRVAQTLQWK